MIPFFRKIRYQLAKENRFLKYSRYAIGEIVLVVIGILIALQINNWNDERIAERELHELLARISDGVQTDIKNLNLLSTARKSISVKADSVFKTYILKDVKNMENVEVSFVASTFQNVSRTINFETSLNVFEDLNNSKVLGKIQGTDLALLLNAYITSAQHIKDREGEHNKNVEALGQQWQDKFNHIERIFFAPWTITNDFSTVATSYFEILRDPITRSIFGWAASEDNALQTYEEQVLMGETMIDMIKNSKTEFDQQTKLNFSGILYSFGDADYLSVLINGQEPSGFDFRYATSSIFENPFRKQMDYLEITYAEKKFDWASAYIWVSALKDRVNEMDLSSYSKVRIEMKGDKGGEAFELTMKDKNDPPDGTESRIKVALTKDWKLYEFETSRFQTADMRFINVPMAFVFQGPEGRTIHVRSIQFE